jgi:lipoprotein-anchoring transpeptidase ErfK/SrfK
MMPPQSPPLAKRLPQKPARKRRLLLPAIALALVALIISSMLALGMGATVLAVSDRATVMANQRAATATQVALEARQLRIRQFFGLTSGADWLSFEGYNPLSDQTSQHNTPYADWQTWLADDGVGGFVISAALAEAEIARYAAALPAGQTIDQPAFLAEIQQGMAAGQRAFSTRIYNAPSQYSVQYGDTLGAISWRVGVQMFRIQAANPGLNFDALAVGQQITIPSKDDLLPLPAVKHKRIIVSIAEQRVRVYESGALKWDWPASTGISSSPTMPGIFQVQSHDGEAYASNWNLYMPYFMSIYEAVPGFYNGFHGFPSRAGAQILWQNALGAPVTYGCILLSTENAKLLYQWAEAGVVVEIRA